MMRKNQYYYIPELRDQIWHYASTYCLPHYRVHLFHTYDDPKYCGESVLVSDAQFRELEFVLIDVGDE